MNKKIILGGGCFWCIQAVFDKIPGIVSTYPGYSGGEIENPSYEQVSTGETGHAEVVEVEYDAVKIKLERILELFFKVHNPTTLNRQGNDVGSQYRSMILFTELEQEKIISSYINKIKIDYSEPIVTEVKELDIFYRAEEYHDKYFIKNPDQAYCQIVIRPKIKKIEKILNKKYE